MVHQKESKTPPPPDQIGAKLMAVMRRHMEEVTFRAGTQIFTQQNLADIIGASRERVSTVLAEWHKADISRHVAVASWSYARMIWQNYPNDFLKIPYYFQMCYLCNRHLRMAMSYLR